MNVSPKEFTHNPRTNPECAVRVLRHSRLGKLHRRIYNKLKYLNHQQNCMLQMKKRFTCACNQFMNLANGTTTLLNHRLYCLLLLPLTPLPPPPIAYIIVQTTLLFLHHFRVLVWRLGGTIIEFLNTTENPGQTNHSRSIKRKIRVFKCKGV